ncbi:MAG: MMPL family transporter [Bacteroidia bacterium]|nr:MMPL family transporter [Bacteroidia bacterium]
MWNSIASFILRGRFWLLLIIAASTVFMGWRATKVEVGYNNKKIIPVTDPDYIDYERFQKTFGEDAGIIVIGIKTNKLFQLDFFNGWYDLAEDIDSIKGIEKVVSITKLYNITKDDSLQQFAINQLFNRKPNSQEELDSFKKVIQSLTFYKDLLYKPSDNTTLMAITMNKKELESINRIKITHQVEDVLTKFSDKYKVKAHISGLPFIRTVFATKVNNELRFFTLLSVLITAVILLVFFRSFNAVFYSLVVVVTCVIWTVGSIELFGYKVSILTGVVPPLIVVIAIQNCIYLLNVYHFEYKSHGIQAKALSRIITKIGLASFLTNVTTAVGFGVFSFSGSAILDEFSIISTVNILVVYVLSHIMIPAIFSYLKAPTKKEMWHLDRKTLSGALNFVSNIINGNRKAVYWVTGVIVAISAFGISKIHSVGYMLDDMPKKDRVFTDLKFFEDNFNGVMPYEISIDTKKPNGVKDIAVLQKIDRLQKTIKKFPEFSKSVSIVDVLKFGNQAYNDGSAKRYIMPGVMDISNIVSLLPKGSGSGSIVKSMVDTTYRFARISMQMADVGSKETVKLNAIMRSKIDSIFDPKLYDVDITGTTVIQMKGNAYLIKNLSTSMAWALLIISIMMTFMFFSWRMTLIALVPNIIPLIITLGIMGFAGIPLKNSTIIVFSIAYGIVVDLTIHFLAKYRVELKKQNWQISTSVRHSIQESGFSMIYTTIVLFFGFVIFAFSTFGGTVALGVLTSICLVIGLLTNMFLLPSMLLSLEKHMNMKEELKNALIEDVD